MLRHSLRLIKQVASREITLMQAYYKINMRLFNSQKALQDDFDWSKYHFHYKEELKSAARMFTLLPQDEQFAFLEGKITQLDTQIKSLLVNHHLLYETILNLSPSSVLEIGCGGGDHLRNIGFFNPKIQLFGIDRSEKQFVTLRERHPTLDAQLNIIDVTQPDVQLPKVDVVYSQAVFMHISETGQRFQTALTNAFSAAQQQVVMIENWTEHDFLSAVQAVIAHNSEWQDAKCYVASRTDRYESLAMIVSKSSLPLPQITTYDDLLKGQILRPH